MRKVYISYAKADGAVARKISDQLNKADLTTWLYERDLQPGDDWQEQQVRAMRDSTHGLYLLSSASMQSPTTRPEWQYFLIQNKPLVIAQIEDVPPELIPGEFKRLTQIDLRHNFNKGMRGLIETLRSDNVLVTQHAAPRQTRSAQARASVTLELDLKELDTQKLVALITELTDKGVEDIRVVQVG
jgi:hypothetical protein